MKVVSLRNHLCADEHVQLARAEAENDFLVRVSPRSRVPIKARDAERRKTLLKNLFDLFRPLADEIDELPVAGRALGGRERESTVGKTNVLAA